MKTRLNPFAMGNSPPRRSPQGSNEAIGQLPGGSKTIL